MKRWCELGSAALVVWLALLSTVWAQASTTSSVAPRPAQNGLFLEVLGPSIVYSLNYERLFFDQVAVRVGFSPLFSSGRKWFFSAPATVTYVGLGGFEAGVGVTLLSDRAPLATTLAGYRLHPRDGAGFQLRMGGMVIMGQGLTHFSNVVPWTYLSVGVGF